LAAGVSLALHAFLVVPTFWASGTAAPHPPVRDPAEGAALQWVVLDDSPKAAAAPLSQESPFLVAIGLSDSEPVLPAVIPEADASKHQDVETHSSPGEISGRYVGQIQARIERAWLRPRTAIGAPIFQCQVQVDQDGVGQVGDVTLLKCNGDARWQLSLVHAIEAASPLPAAPAATVFARHVLLEFRAMAYAPGADAGLYEPAARPAPTEAEESKGTFEALREVAAPHAHKVIRLRIEGSKAEIEPDP
jgi:hypothetical protein